MSLTELVPSEGRTDLARAHTPRPPRHRTHVSALFLVRKGAQYLQAPNGWGDRSSADRFSEANAVKLALEWTKALALPADRCSAEPVEADRQEREPLFFFPRDLGPSAGSVLTNATPADIVPAVEVEIDGTNRRDERHERERGDDGAGADAERDEAEAGEAPEAHGRVLGGEPGSQGVRAAGADGEAEEAEDSGEEGDEEGVNEREEEGESDLQSAACFAVWGKEQAEEEDARVRRFVEAGFGTEEEARQAGRFEAQDSAALDGRQRAARAPREEEDGREVRSQAPGDRQATQAPGARNSRKRDSRSRRAGDREVEASVPPEDQRSLAFSASSGSTESGTEGERRPLGVDDSAGAAAGPVRDGVERHALTSDASAQEGMPRVDVAIDRAPAVTVDEGLGHTPLAKSESGAPARGVSWAVHHGSCFEIVGAFANDSIDICVMDPPYSARQHKGVRSSKRNRLLDGNGRMSKAAVSRMVDLGFEHWTRREVALIAHVLHRVVRRWVITFCDDDLLPVWRACGARAGFHVVRTSVWRRVGGAPQFTGDRPASDIEYIVVMHRKGKKRWNGGGYGISKEYLDDPRDYPDDQPGLWLEYPIVANRSGHRDDRLGTTPKPLSLMLDLVTAFSEPGETVLDATCGPGTTGVAALRLGRSFIGCELLQDRAEMARERLAAEDRGLSLQAVRKGQLGIFDLMGGDAK